METTLHTRTRRVPGTIDDGEFVPSVDVAVDTVLRERIYPLALTALRDAPASVRVAAAEACERAAEAAACAGKSADARLLGPSILLGGVLAASALDHDWTQREVATLIAASAGAARVEIDALVLAVGSRALRDPRLLELPPALAADALLRLLFVLAPVRDVSLWVTSDTGKLRRAVARGAERSPRRGRTLARSILSEETTEVPRDVLAVPVVRWQRPVGVLVAATRNDQAAGRARVLVQEAAATLASVLERDLLLQRGVAQEQAATESSERRLARLVFDVHDGPTQALVAVAADVRLFEEQMRNLFPSSHSRAIALGRVGDVQARLTEVEHEIRLLMQALEPAAIARKPLEEALRDQIVAFQSHGVSAELDVRGDVTPLTASQRIALARIVQESLANARDHGGATHIRVSIVMRRAAVRAEIEDDGSGFDVPRTLAEAARNGRLGLVGMSERVRLLGGTFDVRSRPGGPTKVVLTLPAWAPLADLERGDARSASGRRVARRGARSLTSS